MASRGVPMPDLPGVEHRWVRAGEVELHVAEAGEGPPLVLVHGWPQHWWSWRQAIGGLATTHRVICPDLRGFGWSQAPRGDYAKATLAGDLLALLDAMDIGHAHVVGHDWGGWTGFLLAMRAPERVTGLLALSIPPPWFRSKRSPGSALFASYHVLLSTPIVGQALLRSTPRAVETLVRAGAHRRSAFSDADLRLYSSVLRDPDRAAATTALYRTFLLHEVHHRGRQRRPPAVPYRTVIGAKDPLLQVIRRVPGEIETVPDAGHFLPEEAPEAVLTHVRALLAQP